MLINLIVNALAFYVTAYIVPGVRIENFEALAVVAIVWGVLSLVVRPILILLTLPVNILTLGLFTFVINAFLIMLMASFVRGFRVDNFGAALIAAVVLALVNIVLGKLA
ncbi:MAG: phage holin family protein [Patescibacteria group bacterium]